MDRQRTQNENIIGLKVGSFNSQGHITQFINKLEFSVLFGNEFCVNTEKNYNMALTGCGFHFLVSSSFSFGTNFCVFLLLQSCQTCYNICISKPSDAFKCHHKTKQICNTRPEPPFGRQGLAGLWGKDKVRRVNFGVFPTSH